jgi:putative SOS response-associated peptidase YedK
MCSQFRVDQKVEALERALDVAKAFPMAEAPDRVLPHRWAYVVVRDHGRRVLKPMRFSLVPAWSPTPRTKFATHNFRVETAAEKPTWRGPLARHRCLVPMTGFFEGIYSGQYAGNMVEFTPKQPHLLVAAGVYEEWVDKSTGEVLESFAVATTDPPAFIAHIGHDRCPAFVPKSFYGRWLDPDLHDAATARDELLRHLSPPEFTVGIDRPMKAGWEKRRTQHAVAR